MKNLHKGCDERIMHTNLLMKCNDLPVDLGAKKERKRRNWNILLRRIQMMKVPIMRL